MRSASFMRSDSVGLLERQEAVDHGQVAVGLLRGDGVAGETVARVDDQKHDFLAVFRVGILLQRVFQRRDGRFVAAYLIIGVGVQIGFFFEPSCEFLVDVQKVVDLFALRIARHEFVDGHQRLPGHRLVARGTRRKVVEAHGVHPLGIFDEAAAAEFAAEVVQQLCRGFVVAVLVLAAGVEERNRIFARRADVVVLRTLEKGRSPLPFLFAVVFQRHGVDPVGLAAFQYGVHAAASAERDRDGRGAEGM